MEEDVKALLTKPEFPRAGAYDLDWMMDNMMGPNALWLCEWLCAGLELREGMRVLDLGCGRALTSIFLAREFGVRVWAADLWIGPDKNWERVREAGVEDLVYPIRAEAHTLPFAKGFFDAMVSIDAYHYFGTDVLYLNYLADYVRPDGTLGVVVPGLTAPIHDQVPAHLLEPQSKGNVFWMDECWCFKTPEFWQRTWQRCPRVDAVQADIQTDGWRHWRDFERALVRSGKNAFPSDAETIERDAGRYLGFVRLRATRNDSQGEDLYDPGLGLKAGFDK